MAAGVPVFYPHRHGEMWSLTSTLPLEATPSAVPCARRHTVMMLDRWNLSHLAQDAALVVSELTSNAVNASTEAFASARVVLRLRSDFTAVVIEVRDSVGAW